jgi:glycosyltransferase 2 family protein
MDAAGPSTVVVVEPPPVATTRSPSDVLRLIVATVLLLALLGAELWFGTTLVKFAHDLLRGLDAVPAWLLDTIVTATRVLALVFIGGGLVVTLVRGQWRFLVTTALAGALAALLVLVLRPVDPNSAAPTSHLDGLVAPGFPSAFGLAITAAIAAAAAPWLTRRWRRIGWVLILLMTFSRFLVAPVAFDSLRGLLSGWFAGSLALVVLGGPSRRPRGDAVAAGLAAAGVPLAALERAGVDARGSTPYFGTSTDGRPLFVKALGADERSADLLFRMYRGLVPHNFGDERPFSSLRRTVEHEALLALTARSYGLRTPALVALATAEPNAFVLAYEKIEGKSLDGVAVDDLTDPFLCSIWTQVAELHRHRIAHRDLRLANLFLGSDGEIWLIDFGFSELAAPELLVDTDRAELVASTATRVGATRAVDAAVAVVGTDALAGVGGRLRAWALSGATRSALKDDPKLLADLHANLARVGATR